MIRSTDHEARGVAALIEYLRPAGGPWLRPFLRAVQDLETAAWEVADHLNIADGFGVILDNIGRLVGRGRGALLDDDYRIGLYAQGRINRAIGSWPDAVAIGDLGTQTTGQTYVVGMNPAAYEVHYTGAVTTPEQLEQLSYNQREIRPLGRRGFFVYAAVARASVHVGGWSQDSAIGGGAQACGWSQNSDVGGRLAYALDLT